MGFTVTASASTREVRFQRNSMLAALEQALMLVSSGLDNVRIVDSLGRSHCPAELGRALSETGTERAKTRRAA